MYKLYIFSQFTYIYNLLVFISNYTTVYGVEHTKQERYTLFLKYSKFGKKNCFKKNRKGK